MKKWIVFGLLLVSLCSAVVIAQQYLECLQVVRHSKNPTWTHVFVAVLPDYSGQRELVLEYEGLDWDEFGWFITWFESPWVHNLTPETSGEEQTFTFPTPLMCIGQARIFMRTVEAPQSHTCNTEYFLPGSVQLGG